MEFIIILSRFLFGIRFTFKRDFFKALIFFIAIVAASIYEITNIYSCYMVLISFIIYYCIGFRSNVSEVLFKKIFNKPIEPYKSNIVYEKSYNESPIEFFDEEIDEVLARKSIPRLLEYDESKNKKYDDYFHLGRMYNNELYIDISNDCHTAIGGNTNSGKTVLQMSLIHQALLKGYKCIIIDKKGTDFPILFEELCSVITEQDEAIRIIELILEEIEARKQLFNNCKVRDIRAYNEKYKPSLSKVILMIDEMNMFLMGDKKEREYIEDNIQKIVMIGRAFGIHLILATQKICKDTLPTKITDLCANRISGRVATSYSSVTVLGNDFASKILKNKGRFAMVKDGINIEFQVPFFKPEIHLLEKYNIKGECLKIN